MSSYRPLYGPPPATPRYRRFASRDLDEVRAYASQVFNPLKLGTPPGLTGIAFSHAQAFLDSMSFNFIDYGHVDGYVDVSIPDIEGCFYLQFSLSGSCELLGAATPAIMHAGSVIVFQPGRPCRLRWRPGYKSLVVRGDHRALERILAGELGQPLTDPLLFETLPCDGKRGRPARWPISSRSCVATSTAGAARFPHRL